MNTAPIKIALRIAGIALVAFAVVRFVTASPPTLLVETHTAPNGSSSIMTVVQISRVIWISAFGGVLLLIVSFMRRKRPA